MEKNFKEGKKTQGGEKHSRSSLTVPTHWPLHSQQLNLQHKAPTHVWEREFIKQCRTCESQDDTEQGHQTLQCLSLSFTQEGAAERNLSCLAWMNFYCCWATRSSKAFIWTSLMKTITRSTQMASFKHEASYSHNKCETAWKLILFLPETVEIKIICIEVQKRLRGITWTMRLQHWRTGWNDSSLAWGMDCFELELWAHPQASMRPGVSHYFDLREDGEMLNKKLQYTEWFLQYTEPRESCCSQAKRVFCAISSEECWTKENSESSFC